jgi:hypothetical protein
VPGCLAGEIVVKLCGEAVDLLGVKVKPEWIGTGFQPAFDGLSQVQMPALSVGQDPVAAVVAVKRKPRRAKKRWAASMPFTGRITMARWSVVMLFSRFQRRIMNGAI